MRKQIKTQKSHPDSVLPKIEEINFETISMIFKDTIRLSMSDVNNEIQKGFAGRNDSSFAKILSESTIGKTHPTLV